MSIDPDVFLGGLLSAGLRAARAKERVPKFLPDPPKGKTIVVGGGKAAAAMAEAVEDHYRGTIHSGLVVTRYQHGLPLKKITVIEAGHPMPDDSGRMGAEKILQLARSLGPDDLLLCLISGGGSALLTLPPPGLTMEDVQAVNKHLLLAGATIHELNCVRKHMSAISGGRLARAANGARVVSLIISDVPGDDLAVIASGPTVGDPTSFADAHAILRKYKMAIPAAVEKHLLEAKEESVKPGDAVLERVENILIARPMDALRNAANYARSYGVTPTILGDAIEGEAKLVARDMAAMALKIAAGAHDIKPPCVLISGGETTVTVTGKGKGGRNGEFVLHFLMATEGHPKMHVMSCGTDGSDGTENNAGAIIHPETWDKVKELGLDPAAFAANNDSWSFFNLAGGLVDTGPTRTNVNDLRAIYITE